MFDGYIFALGKLIAEMSTENIERHKEIGDYEPWMRAWHMEIAAISEQISATLKILEDKIRHS